MSKISAMNYTLLIVIFDLAKTTKCFCFFYIFIHCFTSVASVVVNVALPPIAVGSFPLT